MKTKILMLFSFFLVTSVSLGQDEIEEEDQPDPAARPSWSAGLPERQISKDLRKDVFKPEVDGGLELDRSDFGIQTKPKVSINVNVLDVDPSEIESSDDDSVNEESGEIISSDTLSRESIQTTLPENPIVNSRPEEIPIDPPALEEKIQLEEQTAGSTGVNSTENNVASDVIEVVNLPENTQDKPAEADPIVTKEVVDSQTNTRDQGESLDVATLTPPEKVLDDELTVVDQPALQETQNTVQNATYNWNILKRTEVNYPLAAARDNLSGWVDVSVKLAPDGSIIETKSLKTSRKGRVFIKPALRSVNAWRFDPPANYGINTNISRVYRIIFEI